MDDLQVTLKTPIPYWNGKTAKLIQEEQEFATVQLEVNDYDRKEPTVIRLRLPLECVYQAGKSLAQMRLEAINKGMVGGVLV